MKKHLLALASALFFNATAMAATVAEDVARYAAIFNGPPAAHADAAEALTWAGLSDPRVFDLIEQRLLQDGAAASDRDRIARYVRALGYSGQDKYIPTLRKLREDKAYKSYATSALEDMADYRKWNAIISDRSAFDPSLSDDVNRVANMLRSDDPLLQRLGAKRVHFVHKNNPVLLDLVAGSLEANYKRNDPLYTDTLAWQVKVLARSRQEKYMPLMRTVRDGAADPRISEAARRVALRIW